MGEALSRAFVSRGIFAGQVWLIPDHLLTFADKDPSKRTVHSHRPVLVVQGDDQASNANCQTILVMPLSSDTSRQRPWEDLISGLETPLDNPSIVKVHLIQPINREPL